MDSSLKKGDKESKEDKKNIEGGQGIEEGEVTSKKGTLEQISFWAIRFIKSSVLLSCNHWPGFVTSFLSTNGYDEPDNADDSLPRLLLHFIFFLYFLYLIYFLYLLYSLYFYTRYTFTPLSSPRQVTTHFLYMKKSQPTFRSIQTYQLSWALIREKGTRMLRERKRERESGKEERKVIVKSDESFFFSCLVLRFKSILNDEVTWVLYWEFQLERERKRISERHEREK